MILLTLRLYATLRERACTSEVRHEFREGTTTGEAWRWLTAQYPALAGFRGRVAFAVNEQYVNDDYRPYDRDEVAFIPPVSGGAGAGQVGSVSIGRDVIDVEALRRSVADPSAGALVTFEGVTRHYNVGREVLRLEYECYERMALSEMRKLAHEATERWNIVRIAIEHRVGFVDIGEVSVAIAVSAVHRKEAFEACNFVIDRLKEVVPIWKKEYFQGGHIWIESQSPDAAESL